MKIKQVWMLDPTTGLKPGFGLGVEVKVSPGGTINFTVQVDTDEDPKDDDVGQSVDTSVRWQIRTQSPEFSGPIDLAVNPPIIYTGAPGALTPVNEFPLDPDGIDVTPDAELFGTVNATSGLYTAPSTIISYPCIIPSTEFVAQRSGDGAFNGAVLVYAISNADPKRWRFKYPSAYFDAGSTLGANISPGWSTAFIEYQLP